MPGLLILAAALAVADTPAADAPFGDLQTIAAYEVSTIDARRIEQVPSGRIEDALAEVAGLQLFRRSDGRASNPSADGFTLRGLGGNAASRPRKRYRGRRTRAVRHAGTGRIARLDPRADRGAGAGV